MKNCREVWLKEGLLALAKVGPQALTVEIMCRRMGVTKGSFYHHFKNRQDYIENILKLWEEENTSRLIDITEENTGIRDRLNALLKLIFEIPKDREMAVRALALYDRTARKYQVKIDTERRAYLLSLNKKFTKNSKEAELFSTIDYAWYIGIMSILPEISQSKLSEIIKMYKMLKQSYIESKKGG
jgi:AcrR family transcriptional regulator